MTNALQSASTRPYVKQFDCPSCGASVTIRTPGRSLVASCASCGSLADVTDENYKIIATFYGNARLEPIIELGSRGKLNGKTWEVIGMMERSDASDNNFSWSDESSAPVTWQEYLLFNPRYGYRWLLQSDGHWSLIQTTMKQPEMLTELFPASKRKAKLNDQVFKCFFQGRARVTYVLGEFYWQVQVGETAEVEDYIAPPYSLSQEVTDAESVWSVGEYISPEAVQEAFNLNKETLPKPKGVAPSQVWPKRQQFQIIMAIWAVAVCLLLAIQVLFVNGGQTENAFEHVYTLTPNVVNNEPITTPSFDLKAGLATTKINIETQANNSSISLDGELVNETTGAVFPFEKVVEYYFGTDSGESWSEGSTRGDIVLSSIPGGRYHMNLDMLEESTSLSNYFAKPIKISVQHHVPTYGNLLWILFLVSILPIIILIQRANFEAKRNENSYYPLEDTESDDE